MNEQGDDEAINRGERAQSLLSLGSAIEAERQRLLEQEPENAGPENFEPENPEPENFGPEKRRSTVHADAVNRHKRARVRRESRQSEILAALAHEPEPRPSLAPELRPEQEILQRPEQGIAQETVKPGLIDRFFGRRKSAHAPSVNPPAPVVEDREYRSTLDRIEDELARQEAETAFLTTGAFEPTDQPARDRSAAYTPPMAEPYVPTPQPAQSHAPWPGQTPQPSYASLPSYAPQPPVYGHPSQPQAYATAYPQTAYPGQSPIYPSQPFAHQPTPQPLAPQSDQASLQDIAESLREFRDAVRELTESRQRRRYF